MISFFINGTPSPGGSKNAFVHPHTKRIVVTDAGGKKTKDWKAAVAKEAKIQMRVNGWTRLENVPVAVVCHIYVKRPKSHFNTKGALKASAPRFPISKPDATKLFRSTEDALTGICWDDDARIIDQRVVKNYADDFEEGAMIFMSHALQDKV